MFINLFKTVLHASVKARSVHKDGEAVPTHCEKRIEGLCKL